MNNRVTTIKSKNPIIRFDIYRSGPNTLTQQPETNKHIIGRGKSPPTARLTVKSMGHKNLYRLANDSFGGCGAEGEEDGDAMFDDAGGAGEEEEASLTLCCSWNCLTWAVCRRKKSEKPIDHTLYNRTSIIEMNYWIGSLLVATIFQLNFEEMKNWGNGLWVLEWYLSWVCWRRAWEVLLRSCPTSMRFPFS